MDLRLGNMHTEFRRLHRVGSELAGSTGKNAEWKETRDDARFQM